MNASDTICPRCKRINTGPGCWCSTCHKVVRLEQAIHCSAIGGRQKNQDDVDTAEAAKIRGKGAIVRHLEHEDNHYSRSRMTRRMSSEELVDISDSIRDAQNEAGCYVALG